MEKYSQSIAEEMTQYWISVVQDEQIQKLCTQLNELEAQLTMLRGSLKMMPPIV